MALPSPAKQLFNFAFWAVVHVVTLVLVDTYGVPLLDSLLEKYLGSSAYVAGLSALCRFLLALQTVSLLVYLQHLAVGPSKFSFQGKHVVVTGGSQGLGFSIAKKCLEQGAKVTIVARTEGKLQAACKSLEGMAPSPGSYQVRYEALDLGKATSMDLRAMFENSAAAFGRVDAVFANAGYGVAKLVIDADHSKNDIVEKDSYLERIVNLNTLGTLRTVVAASDLMVSDGKGGRICLVSSAAGLNSSPGYAFYSATKFSHRGFVEGAYEELKHRGVHLSVYFPGTIKTPGYQTEQSLIPAVTARVEAQCSDIDEADNCAATLLKGIAIGKKEITNELLFQITTSEPTGNYILDPFLYVIVYAIYVGYGFYKKVMVSHYVKKKFH